MKILIIRKIFKHHSKYSGYDVLFNSDIFKNALCININRIDKYVKGWGWLITYLKKKYIIKQKYYTY